MKTALLALFLFVSTSTLLGDTIIPFSITKIDGPPAPTSATVFAIVPYVFDITFGPQQNQNDFMRLLWANVQVPFNPSDPLEVWRRAYTPVLFAFEDAEGPQVNFGLTSIDGERWIVPLEGDPPEATPNPEPATLGLFVMGLSVLGIAYRKRLISSGR